MFCQCASPLYKLEELYKKYFPFVVFNLVETVFFIPGSTNYLSVSLLSLTKQQGGER